MTLEDVDQTTGAIARRVVRIGCRRRFVSTTVTLPAADAAVGVQNPFRKQGRTISHVTGFRDASGAESLLGSSCHHLSLHRRS